MANAKGDITIKGLSVILGLIAMIGGGGFVSGQLYNNVQTNKKELNKICDRLDSIESKIEKLSDCKIVVSDHKSKG